MRLRSDNFSERILLGRSHSSVSALSRSVSPAFKNMASSVGMNTATRATKAIRRLNRNHRPLLAAQAATPKAYAIVTHPASREDAAHYVSKEADPNECLRCLQAFPIRPLMAHPSRRGDC